MVRRSEYVVARPIVLLAAAGSCYGHNLSILNLDTVQSTISLTDMAQCDSSALFHTSTCIAFGLPYVSVVVPLELQ